MTTSIDLDHTIGSRKVCLDGSGWREVSSLSVFSDEGVYAIEAGTKKDEQGMQLRLSARELLSLGHACVAAAKNALDQGESF